MKEFKLPESGLSNTDLETRSLMYRLFEQQVQVTIDIGDNITKRSEYLLGIILAFILPTVSFIATSFVDGKIMPIGWLAVLLLGVLVTSFCFIRKNFKPFKFIGLGSSPEVILSDEFMGIQDEGGLRDSVYLSMAKAYQEALDLNMAVNSKRQYSLNIAVYILVFGALISVILFIVFCLLVQLGSLPEQLQWVK